MTCTCRIQWVDDNSGKPTPDENPAVAFVYVAAHTWTLHGRTHWSERSETFPICAAHLDRLRNAQLNARGFEHWRVLPMPNF